MPATRPHRHVVLHVATVIAVAATTLGLMQAPAGAAVTGLGGAVGVPQVVVVTNTTPALFGQSTCAMVPTINGTTQLSVTGPLVNGTASFTWTPTSVGAATFTMPNCTTTSTIPAASITQVPTTTTIATPNTTRLGQATQITVTVQSSSPSAYQPTGQVVVRNANGALLQTMGLTPGPGNGQAYAYYWWTPTLAGTYFFQATYGGDSNATGSVSPQDTIIATSSGNTITLTAPATMTQGVPVTLLATVFPAGVQGSVGFTLNGAPISASVPIVNGQASLLWTPTGVGNVVLGANYTTNSGGSGSTTDNVTIVPGPVSKDVITLTQPGYGTWAPSGTFPLGNGTTFTFQASTLSGASVVLSETGPCQVSGLTLIVDQGSGQCNLVASSSGGNGYAPIQQGYVVTLLPGTQTAVLAAPQSGNINAGRTITLATPSQGQTNAGQNITWQITTGRNKVCSLKFPSNGATKLKMLKKGQCNVRGSARGVSGQWNAYRLARSYRGV